MSCKVGGSGSRLFSSSKTITRLSNPLKTHLLLSTSGVGPSAILGGVAKASPYCACVVVFIMTVDRKIILHL